MKKYKYFADVEQYAFFTKTPCQFCGNESNCLEGIYFDRENIESVCMSCFEKMKACVEVPSYIRRRVNIDSATKIEQLKYTPPIPWVQYNDWQVCCDDFMTYIGEYDQDAFSNKYGVEGTVELFESMLSKDTHGKVDDINVLWEDIGYNTVAYFFMCSHCGKTLIVCQSY